MRQHLAQEMITFSWKRTTPRLESFLVPSSLPGLDSGSSTLQTFRYFRLVFTAGHTYYVVLIYGCNQERVDENQRGVINGVEMAMCNSFDLVKFVLVMFLPNVETFGFLVIISLGSISLGWCFFLKYVIASRKLDKLSVEISSSTKVSSEYESCRRLHLSTEQEDRTTSM